MEQLLNLQPLERHFSRLSKDKTSFPRIPSDYFIQYQSLVNHLKTNIYPGIDAGLSANSEKAGYYTAHNAEHFDEVVRYAGDLLNANTEDFKILNPYELYVLLVAIRIHDAGNIKGREQHEKRCFELLRSIKDLLGGDLAELKIISKIAEAHGGKVNGDKDTIRYLDTYSVVGSTQLRPRLLAAILRFADEICENRGRAANYLLEHGTLPTQSEIYHRYAAAIGSVVFRPNESRLSINFQINIRDAVKQWGCEERIDADGKKIDKVYLIDEIFDRLDKMDCERKYCNTFTRGVYAVDSIRASLTIVNDDHDTLEVISIPELTDIGYPTQGITRLKDTLHDYCGESYAKSLQDNHLGGEK